MATKDRYAYPTEGTSWTVPGAFDTQFNWEYEGGNDALLRLYEKGKDLQWNTTSRIDWSQDLDPENPRIMPDRLVSFGFTLAL